MRRVILESPYAGKDASEVGRNKRYARGCMRDCLLRGEAPIASHLLYTQEGVLDDNVPAERELGIAAGLEWGKFAEATVVYTDYGISQGMECGIARAKIEGRPVEYRELPSLVKLTEGACLDRRVELLSFADTGNLTTELESHLGTCTGCKTVFNRIIEETNKALQLLARMFREGM